MYRIYQHETGLAIAAAEMPHMSSISLGIWVGVGGRYEPASLCGASHFIEHMLFKGTRRRNAKQISQDVEGIGGYLNAFTSEETTCFFSKAGHAHFDDLWDVLSDMFLNSTFDSQELEKERNVIREELAMYQDQPHHYVQELLNEAMWPDQPLGRPLTGTLESLNALKRSELIGYMRQNYVTQGTLIAVAGRVDAKNIAKKISRQFGKFPRAERQPFLTAHVEQNTPRVRLHTKPIEQSQLALGIRTCSRHDPRRYALRLLNVILGENMSSRLFQRVREEHGLAYTICSSLSFFDDVGALTISAGLEPEKAEKALKLIIQELNRLCTVAPSRAELRRAKDYLFGQLDLSLENTENQMMWMGEQYFGYGKIISPEETKLQLSQVTAGQIRRAARDFFRPERLNLALVSPVKRTNGLGKVLERAGTQTR